MIIFVCLSTGRVVVVVGASGSRSNRQAGSERVEHEPALPRVRGAQLATPALAGGGLRGQRARLPAQQQQPGAKGMRRLQRQDRGEVPAARAGPVLAPRLPEVRLLRTGPRRHGPLLLLQRRDDIMQKRLHKVSTICIFNLIISTCLSSQD